MPPAGQELSRQRHRSCWRPRWVAPCSTRRCRRTTRTPTTRWARSSWVRSSTTWPSATRRSRWRTVSTQLKDLGFHWATRSGVTVSIGDVSTPADKPQILAVYEDRATKIDKQYERGLITEDERRQELIEIWTDATSRLGTAMETNFSKTNPIYMMVHSGARGNMVQMRQIAAMRGLVVNPKGEIIARPIKSNFREGLSVLEYFISTHGGRKGQADTALRTADSGYLTRRLVDVSQDVIIREEDCGTERGLTKTIARADGPARQPGPRRARGDRGLRPHPRHRRVRRRTVRCCCRPESILVTSTSDCSIDNGVTSVKVRSVLTCEAATRHLRDVLRPFAGQRQAGRRRRGRRHRRGAVDR